MISGDGGGELAGLSMTGGRGVRFFFGCRMMVRPAVAAVLMIVDDVVGFVCICGGGGAAIFEGFLTGELGGGGCCCSISQHASNLPITLVNLENTD